MKSHDSAPLLSDIGVPSLKPAKVTVQYMVPCPTKGCTPSFPKTIISFHNAYCLLINKCAFAAELQVFCEVEVKRYWGV